MQYTFKTYFLIYQAHFCHVFSQIYIIYGDKEEKGDQQNKNGKRPQSAILISLTYQSSLEVI
jgi:hypothetical protein